MKGLQNVLFGIKRNTMALQSERELPGKLDSWQVLQEQDEINNPWIRVRNVTFLLPNGDEMKDYFIVEKPSVVIVIPIREGKTFLIREYERGVAEVGHKFPAGRLGAREDPVQAADREFREELGMCVQRLIPLGERYVEPGFMTTRCHYFLGLDLIEIPEGKEDNPFELFEGEWVDFSSLGPLIASGEIKNPFVIVGYTLASMELKKAGLI